MKLAAGVLTATLLTVPLLGDGQFPDNPSFTTVSITPLAIEGLTGDGEGTLFTTGRAAVPARCPVWRIDAGSGTLVSPLQIGSIPNAVGCNPSGIARDAAGSFMSPTETPAAAPARSGSSRRTT